MRQAKVLQICAVDFTVRNLLLPLIDKLLEEGFETHVICSDGPEIGHLRKKGYKIKTINILRRISPISNLISAVRIYKYIIRNNFDIVHVHTPVAGILGRIAAKLAGVPLIVYTAHGFYFHDRMPSWKRESLILIEKFFGRFFTDIIFTQSEEDRSIAITKGIIAEEKIFYIGNGVNIEKFNINNININLSQKRKDLDIDPDVKVIGFIGRIVREKGIVDLILAFKKILEINPNICLVVIGDSLSSDRDLTTRQEVLTIINLFKLGKKVVFTGYRNDINELLAVVDVFVLPSYREGMPRCVIEAMAMGKPVVATNIRGCREEVVDGITGVLVPVGDPDKLAEAITKILGDSQMSLEMGKEGMIRARSLFNEEKVLDKQIGIIYEQVESKLKKDSCETSL